MIAACYRGRNMADLPSETTEIINKLKQQSLNIVNKALALELTIFELFGETDATIAALDEMKSAAENAESSYSQLSLSSFKLPKLNLLPLVICYNY